MPCFFRSLAMLDRPRADCAEQCCHGADRAEQGVQTLCQPEVIGNRRIPKESVLARLFSHQNDLYDPAVVERDFNSLWNTGYFDNVRIERVDTPKCVQLDHLCQREADHPRDQLQGSEFGHAVRRAGALQEGQGRALGREPVRPDQDQAGRGRPEGAAGRAWPSVRHASRPRSRRFRRRRLRSPST